MPSPLKRSKKTKIVHKAARTDSKKKAARGDANLSASPETSCFPIVGLGASAGGLQVFTQFLKAIPANSGMAFVLVQHLDPDHKSLMVKLLESHTKMSVALASDGISVAPNHVYVIPPKATLLLEDGKLRVTAPQQRNGDRLPIDAFFRSLAEEKGNRAIGIVLSGSGGDGMLGLKAIKQVGGYAIAQEPSEAPHDGMPRNAIANNATNQVLAIIDMPNALQRYANTPCVDAKGRVPVLGDRARAVLGDVIAHLKRLNNIDFALYKEGTLLRRIERRMGVRQVIDAADYLKLINNDVSELDLLAKDLLINVSGFFRDKAVFEHLETKILPDAVKNHSEDQPFRIWVAGCASGEEAYSFSMLLIEQAAAQNRRLKIQIFATDLDTDDLEIARAGVYADTIEGDVSASRLARFFDKEDHHYTVKTELRETVVFAAHNLLSDAPFSKLDLVSCRNVLIYLDTKVQAQIIRLFHFSLKKDGILILGTSETVSAGGEYFDPIDRKLRLFRRMNVRVRQAHPIASTRRFDSLRVSQKPALTHATSNLKELTRRLLLERHTPAAVLINNKALGLYFTGPVDRFLRVPAGEAGQDLLAMVREGLRNEMRAAVKKSLDTNGPVVTEGVWLKHDDVRKLVSINVEPVENEDRKLLLVTFTEQSESRNDAASPGTNTDQSAVLRIKKELDSTRRELKLTISNLEVSHEELKAANEEAMSMNEEFQSTNEELETSKEELQSLNEELTTLNSQLQENVEDHRRAVDDLNNLLNSAKIATLFLDKELRIKRFTPTAKGLFNIIASDIDRPLSDITYEFEDDDLISDCAEVLASLIPVDLEVKATAKLPNGRDRWILRRVLPYRTLDNKVDGVVVTLDDITQQKAGEALAQSAQHYAEAIVNTIREPIIVLDASLTVVSAGHSFYEKFKTTQNDTEGKLIYELGEGQWDIPELRTVLTEILSKKTVLDGYEVSSKFPNIGERTMLLNARVLESGDDRADLILLAIDDITQQKTTDAALDQESARVESILRSAQLAIVTINEAGIIQSFGAGAEELFGYGAKEVIGQNVNVLMPEPDRSHHDGYIAAYLTTGEKKIIGLGREVTGRCKDGTLVPLDLSIGEAYYDHSRLFSGVMRDLSNDKKRQQELFQAQKMEAMGQLTGGVAHDFNNLLTVILGNLELIEQGKHSDHHGELLNEAREAVKLGSDLTRGLLAFGRRLPLSPEIIDINETILQMSGILKRTLPETIQVSTILGKDLCSVEVDAAQLQNAVLNLGLNAKDAMPDGGKLIVETSNIKLDADYAERHQDVVPGDYVAISVMDTGEGMLPDVQRRAFDPFFTTKEVGRGTGLGLSMIYGFVKQSGGHATIYSDHGKGSTISLFFPRLFGQAKAKFSPPRDLGAAGAGEKILVVEDDARVRRVTVRRLESLGYIVQQAGNGPAALSAIEKDPGIDLLFTDMVMPGGMGGGDLALAAVKKNPGLKVLLTSGYAEAALNLEKDEYMLRKPYTSVDLAHKLRQVLGS